MLQFIVAFLFLLTELQFLCCSFIMSCVAVYISLIIELHRQSCVAVLLCLTVLQSEQRHCVLRGHVVRISSRLTHNICCMAMWQTVLKFDDTRGSSVDLVCVAWRGDLKSIRQPDLTWWGQVATGNYM